MRLGAVVLAGGRSSRMGRPKALLDWHGRPAVGHAVEVVSEGVGGGPVCVVSGYGQELPPLDAILVADEVAYPGPLSGLVSGLRELTGRADLAFACGVDTPLLVPAFVRAVCGALRDGDDAVVPVIGGRQQPLLAAYRTILVPRLETLLERGGGGLREIPSVCAVRELSEQVLATVDPGLRSAANANTPEEWAALHADTSRILAILGDGEDGDEAEEMDS